jgi:hypothetical protein
MNKILVLFIAGIMTVSCIHTSAEKQKNNPKNTDLIKLNLSGAVKSVEEITYQSDSNGQAAEMDSCCIQTSYFDENGYLVLQVSKNSRGMMKDEILASYYPGGQAKEFITLSAGKKKNRLLLQIDKNGKYNGAQSFDSSGKLEGIYTDLEENEYGAITKGVFRKPDSSIRYSFLSLYDKAYFKNGYQLDSNGKEINYSEYIPDEKGNTIEYISRETVQGSTIRKRKTYSYGSFDEKGNWTLRTVYDENGKAVKIVKRNIYYY